MTKATEIRPSTSIAATSWQAQDGTHIRIYAQYNDGGIRESRWDAQTGWTGGKSKDTIIETTYNNTVLAVANRDNGKLIHVYYTWTEFISGDTFLGEICKDGEGPWYPGALNKAGIKVASNSGLAACADAMGDRDITVLYFRPDYTMFEAVWNKSVWVQRSVTDDAGQAIKNSKSYLGLSAVISRRPPGNIIQAYCMAADGDIGEFCTTQNGTWFIRNVSVSDQLAGGDQARGVTAYIEQGSVNTRVYYMTSGHSEVMERIRTYSPGNTPSWANISSVDGCHPSAGVAVVGASGQEPIRLYSQDVHTNRVQELGWVTEDTEWRVLGYVPTGKVE